MMDMLPKPPTPKQLKNEKALEIYCMFLCGLIFLVVSTRWLNRFCLKIISPDSRSHQPLDFFRRRCLLVFRTLEKRVTTWKWAHKSSWGFVVLVGIYVTCNIALCPTVLALYRLNHFASRFGWLAAGNMVLCVFLGMKNTPLGLLAGTSHTHINPLHRIVGYVTIILVGFHASFYVVHFARNGKLWSLLKVDNQAGIAAGTAMLVLLLGIFRKRHYELFYISHIVGFLLVVLLTALHRPDWAKKLPVVMLVAGFLWTLDRVIRTTRMIRNLINNQVLIYPLPGDGIRLVLKKPSFKAASPGSHCFLWIPRINPYQNHPFTIVSNDHRGLELVIKRQEGFTKRLHNFAMANPGRTACVSIDGPYGSLPDTTLYDKLILVAGGSGAAFTFGLMNYYLNHSDRTIIQSIDFVWAIKYIDHLSWFFEHLEKLTSCGSNVKVKIYVTSPKVSINRNDIPDDAVEEDHRRLETMSQESLISDIGEHQDPNQQNTTGSEEAVRVFKGGADIIYGKLSTETLMKEAMETVGSHDRVLLAACGPKSLTNDLRDFVESYRSSTVDIYCEDFSD